MSKLVLLRHGESVWNQENRFTGWTDVDLSQKGEEEAREAGRLIKEAGITFDVAFTSVLKRAIRTLFIVMEKLELQHIPVSYSWRLNERHYGSLQGMNKSETAKQFGEDQVKKWRRGYTVKPPALEAGDERDSVSDPMYRELSREEVPLGESLEDATKRILPYWEDKIFPELRKGKNVLVSGHGSGIRSIVKFLDKLTDEQVMELDVPTGIPLVYEFDAEGKPTSHYYLGNIGEIQKKIEDVRSQGRAK